MIEIDEKRPRWREWLNDLFSAELEAEHLGFEDLLREAAARELLNSDALNIIYGALQVADMRARDIMIPRSQMASVNVDARLEEFLPFVIEQKHSRFPVIGDDLDDVKGILLLMRPFLMKMTGMILTSKTSFAQLRWFLKASD